MIAIPNDMLEEIRKQAVEEAPDEACGYLGGKDGRVSLRIPMTNIDHSPEHFTFDPKEQFEAIGRAREEGCDLIAVYHSHPATPARMSDEDIRLANDTEMIYVIMSLKENKTKAFTIDADKKVTEIKVQLT